ncbi:hypothetical protein [Novosphingobium guangzhouense]|uniref:Baseplate structural protein Gp9/Gp10 N-terminal domain-containing protein n=1 Tax=Novosphingobium guangzhouense TaxID=1850347 RepID=A0A2K2FUS9_9SPHN|nr:hypothetical protein [Novosphingobium guangzhouense]PNU02526.1 hypothetical protein A8V01_09100 [Novosphingobium guangzhouense]
MARQDIDIGASANDGTGDDLRTAGSKINANFTELYGATEDLGDEIAGKQASAPNLTAIAAATPIADGDHTVGGITITTVGGIITAIA